MIKSACYLIGVIFIFHTVCLANDSLQEMTLAAYNAYKAHNQLGTTKTFTKTTSFVFEGCAGDYNSFHCKHKVTLEVKYSGDKILGTCLYKDQKTVINFEGIEDINGNIQLFEKFQDANINYVFKGIHDDKGIRGLWSKGEGKKQFALNVVLKSEEIEK